MCAICLVVAFIYKLPTFFEMHYEERPNCTDWARYEIAATSLAANENYRRVFYLKSSKKVEFFRFWFMFVTRNIVERIVPFFLLIFLNFMIIRTLRKETRRFANMDKTASCNECLNKRSLKVIIRAYCCNHISCFQDATRTLVAVVSLYLASQSLQVFITFWEAFHRDSLENDFTEVYSYLNDIVSILTLTCSAIRFPVYMSCNQNIFVASTGTLRRLGQLFCGSKHKKQLKTIHSLQQGYVSVPSDTVIVSVPKNKSPNSSHDLYMIRASLEDSEEQWMVQE